MKWYFIILTAVLLFSLTGCDREEPAQDEPDPSSTESTQPLAPGCRSCHKTMQLDPKHNLACTHCHGGNNDVNSKDEAHASLIALPAHPANAMATCGGCHSAQTGTGLQSSHFTLANKINTIRSHFGITEPLANLTDIPDNDQQPNNEQELVNNLLRRRCLRCHIYTSGDAYPSVTHGTGCAACHLQFEEGRLKSHTFQQSPTDRQCLSCHYGNHVGADYYGLYENDFNWEYRTPYTTKQPFARPYGIEQHSLAADIHQQRGLACIDCHTADHLHNDSAPLTCLSCHGWKAGEQKPHAERIFISNDQLLLHARLTGKEHSIPQLLHPAHEQYAKEVTCQVCHAQWSFNDRATHLLYSESEEYDPWERLTVQTSAEVEAFLEHNLYSDEDEKEPAMRDGITGVLRPGIWYKGYGQRRWEEMLIDRDSDGLIKVFRPILDLRISAVDADDEVFFDNVKGKRSGLLPYTPHTTGPAGILYWQRFSHLLNKPTHTSTK